MKVVLNEMKIKYEDKKIWMLRETWGNQKLKNPYWREVKACSNKNDKYKRVTINYKQYLYHRVVYFIHNPKWKIHDSSTDNHIDHIDRNPLHNNIENLRVATHQQNQWNTDAKGFSFRKARGKYEAQICVDGKVKYLGYFVTAEEAGAAYLDAKRSLHQIH